MDFTISFIKMSILFLNSTSVHSEDKKKSWKASIGLFPPHLLSDIAP